MTAARRLDRLDGTRIVEPRRTVETGLSSAPWLGRSSLGQQP
jgi:hypothetical protein